jgi:hypothetical protein
VTDESLICDFENCRLSPGSFRHVDHVRVAFSYLRRLPPLEALSRFSSALERMAAAHGAPDRYHETITWAFVLLIRERIERRARGTGHLPSWDEFAAENPDLLCRNEHALRNYYLDETLRSELARKVFILPDRGLPRPALGKPVRS